MADQERDLSCLDRLRAGDPAALDELYDRHNPLLYSLVLRIVRQVADAEEVVQETWVQAWKRAASYDPARGSVGAWLVTLARSRAIDRLSGASRRAVRAETAVEAEPPNPRDEPPAVAVQGQMRERIVAALGELPPQQRRTLELAYFSGLSQSEISTQLGVPLGTSSPGLARACCVFVSWFRRRSGRERAST
jgi:RNA polymerase sigma-70 factor (ECF subfamily)